jgi:hypothetical protein
MTLNPIVIPPLSSVAQELKTQKLSVKDYFVQNNLLTEEEFEYFISAEHVLSLGC